MREIKVSVIVTIHDVELYLDKCLFSLLHQDFKENYEVVCVNDSPVDNCPKIIDDYTYKYSSIFKRVDSFCKDTGESRNIGFYASKGEYICFVDGDDFVTKSFISDFYEKAISDSSDIVICKVLHKKNRHVFKPFQSLFSRFSIKNPKKACKELFYDVRIRESVFDKFYKRSTFRGVRFLSSKDYAVNVAFNFLAFTHSEKISFIKQRNYFHTRRSTSYGAKTSQFVLCQKLINSFTYCKNYAIRIRKNKFYKMPIAFKMGVFRNMISKTDLLLSKKKIVLKALKKQLKLLKKTKKEVPTIDILSI